VAEKPKAFGSLFVDVVRKGICVFCGACIASCPVGAIWVADENPRLIGRCVNCEVCYYTCPKTGFQAEEMDKAVFGRVRESEGIGVYRSVYTARTTLKDLQAIAQDGGVATTLLICSLEKGMADAVVAAGLTKQPWKPWPLVLTRKEELIKCAGTKYTPSPNLIGLSEAIDYHAKERVAFVGTPCQVQAVRKMQYGFKGCLKLGSRVKVVVGLFCMESFRYADLMDRFLASKGVKPVDVKKFAITKGRFIAYSNQGEAVNVKLDEVKQYAQKGCHVCRDFTAEHADISVGSVGSPDGWNTVIIRTETGEQLFKEAYEAGYLEFKPIEEVKPGLKLVLKLSASKREAAIKEASVKA